MEEGPSGVPHVLTDNTDGRGAPRDGDDRIVQVIPPGGLSRAVTPAAPA